MKIRFLLNTAALALMAFPVYAQAPAGQKAPEQQGPKVKSQKELEALQKVQAAQKAGDADGLLAAITNVLENFADTDFKPQLLNMALGAAEQKNDYPTIVTWSERVIQAEPNDIGARVTLAAAIAQHTRENDLDKADSIKKVQDYARQALDLLKTAATPPAGVPAENFPEYKKQTTAQAYDALGQAAALDKKYPEAIANYKTSIDTFSSPVTVARLAKAYVESKQYDDAIVTADKVLAMNDVPPVVKQFAQQQKDAATKLKGTK